MPKEKSQSKSRDHTQRCQQGKVRKFQPAVRPNTISRDPTTCTLWRTRLGSIDELLLVSPHPLPCSDNQVTWLYCLSFVYVSREGARVRMTRYYVVVLLVYRYLLSDFTFYRPCIIDSRPVGSLKVQYYRALWIILTDH